MSENTVSITWHTQHDARVCPICEAIDGYTWTFTDQVPNSLYHPTYGEVWNINTGSLAHEHKQFGKKYGLLSTCRCHITPIFSLKGLLEKVTSLRDAIKAEVSQT